MPVRSRRSFLGTALASAALWSAGVLSPAVHAAASAMPRGRRWLLTSDDELRPPPPGSPLPTEIDDLLRFQSQRTPFHELAVHRWLAGPVSLPWTGVALDLIVRHQPSPVRAGRALALLHTALDDALAASWDAKGAYWRPWPAALDRRLRPLEPFSPAASSFPSEHAAAAGVAATVLPYLFPQESAADLDTLVEEATTAPLWAGVAFPSDVDAGLALGRAVGERAVARGRADGSDAVWDPASRPMGPGMWQPTPPAFVPFPLDPLAGSWQTWVVDDVPRLRPAPPPASDTPDGRAQLAAVQAAVAQRTPAQAAAVRLWAGGAGTVTPAGLWVQIAHGLIERDALDTRSAARVLALTSVAIADAFICCWDAKYAYWTARPITLDPSLDVLIPTPPFPSYTSGHSTISAAAATVLGGLFPADAAALAEQAEEAKDSRLWAGIHFPADNDTGQAMGWVVGGMVMQQMGVGVP